MNARGTHRPVADPVYQLLLWLFIKDRVQLLFVHLYEEHRGVILEIGQQRGAGTL